MKIVVTYVYKSKRYNFKIQNVQSNEQVEKRHVLVVSGLWAYSSKSGSILLENCRTIILRHYHNRQVRHRPSLSRRRRREEPQLFVVVLGTVDQRMLKDRPRQALQQANWGLVLVEIYRVGEGLRPQNLKFVFWIFDSRLGVCQCWNLVFRTDYRCKYLVRIYSGDRGQIIS